MGRPKSFDRDEALDRAVQCFWARGFEATSIDDLVRETGVGRQSLYNEFGDKRAIYLAALARYADIEHGRYVGIIDSAVPVRAAISDLLATTIKQCVKDPEKGCFMANAGVEMAAQDEEVRKRVLSANGILVRALERRLRDAQTTGEIAAHHDPAALARFFVSQLVALRVIAKAAHDRKNLESIARVALGVLG
jgi:TetR/AcrR family transcriptional repressor of nem operon